MSKLGIGLCTLGLLAAPFLCHGCHKEAIQNELTQTANASLAKANLSNYKVLFNGSDAVLSGPDEGYEKAKSVVDSVCPIFHTITKDTRAVSTVSNTASVASFGLSQLSTDKYELTGVFPTEEARATALRSANDTFGAANVTDKSTVAANAEDSASLGAAFASLKQVEGLSFQREGDVLTLRGRLASGAMKAAIDTAVRKLLPENTTLLNQLVVTDQPAVVGQPVAQTKEPESPTATPTPLTATPVPLAQAVTQVAPDTFTVEVLFATNSAVIESVSKPGLNKLAAALKAQSKSVEVQGHTDSRGSESLNQPLSQRRANAVEKYLIQQGVAADTLTAKGYGSTQPRADNSTDSGRRKNRRIDFKIK